MPKTPSFTPMQIIWCLTFYYTSDPEAELGKDHYNSLAGKQVLAWMKKEELINEDLTITPRLDAFVDFVCETPLPVRKWVRPEELE